MKISTKGRYALRVMVDLATNDNGNYINLKDIAKRQEISNKYLEQIIAMLNKAGFIQTYTDNEAIDVINSAIDDFAASIALGFVSGGASLAYDIATMGYDIVQAIRNTEVSQEDMARYLCEQDVVDQIKVICTTSVRKQLIHHIKTSNKLLYKKIEKEL